MRFHGIDELFSQEIYLEALTDGGVIMHARRQMPVGQGGFHAGCLVKIEDAGDFLHVPLPAPELDRTSFCYVYDCGAEPKRHVNREVSAWLAARPSGTLDLLVLSHFDRDHICGTPFLLRTKGGTQVDTIMLPFVGMSERIVALARALATKDDFGGRIDRFFVDMVFDPVGTLAQFGPRRIILVQSDDDDDGPGGFDPSPEFPGRIGLGEAMWGKLFPATRDPERPMSIAHGSSQDGTEVMTVRHTAIAVGGDGLGLFWKLRPWVRRADPAAVAAFRVLVEQMFGWPTGTFEAHVREKAVRRQMVTSKRSQLAQAYRAAFSDKNLTSLCLYSGPLDPDRIDAMSYSNLDDHELTKIGWMGTGDAELRGSDAIAQFERGFDGDIDYASTFMLPHHGSIKNSDPRHLVSQADIYVAAADPVHHWPHPHWALIGAAEANGYFCHVRSWQNTALDEAFLLLPRASA